MAHITTRKIRVQRSKNGNMLLMCVVVIFILLFVVGCAFFCLSLFYSRDEVQNRAGSAAITTAQILNGHDFAGRMNNMIVHSRELVFDSRRMLNRVERDEDLTELRPLALQLMNESRQAAIDVEKERNQLAAATVTALRREVSTQTANPFQAVSMVDSGPSRTNLLDVHVGTVDSMESNVEASEAVEDLVNLDLARGSIKSSGFCKLYKASTNLRLAAPDDDLRFELSPLPAPVDGTTAPARLINPERFKKLLSLRENGSDTKQTFSVIPCAVQLVTALPVHERIVGNLQSSIGCTNTAIANGGVPEQ